MHRSGGEPLKDRATGLRSKSTEVIADIEVVESTAMQRDIAWCRDNVAVHGILFDFDKDTMWADSKPPYSRDRANS